MSSPILPPPLPHTQKREREAEKSENRGRERFEKDGGRVLWICEEDRKEI